MEIDNSSSSSSGLGSTRQRFNIELRPGETTIVSWKKLIKEANNKPEPSTPLDVQPSHLSSATVQQRAQEVQVALDEYFRDEKSTSKSNDFSVNTGKLEHLNEPMSSSDGQLKQRKKHMPKALEEKVDDHVPDKHAKLGHAKLKVAAENVPLVGQNSSHYQNFVANSEHYHERKLQHSQNSSIGCAKKKHPDTIPKSEYSFYSGVLNNDASAVFENSEDIDKQRLGNAQCRNSENNVKSASGFSGATHMKSEEKNASKQQERQAKRILTNTNELESSFNAWQREKNGKSGLPDLNMPACPMESVASQKHASGVKDFPALRPKGTTLERAIRELEKVVAETRPTNLEVQEADTSSMAIKRRLPREVKQKLAKVARLASSQGRISEELVNRLMSILGHLVQLRTLKRNLKEMVLLGLSAKREKADRIQLIKKEVIEMIQLQASKVSSGAADDFQKASHSEEKGFLKERICINSMLEDKICDLYDLYIQEMDEDKGPQIRKLYAELAELWPEGAMDNHGIKKAIRRARERRRSLYDGRKVQEKARTRKLPTPRVEGVVLGEVSSLAQPIAVDDRMITETNSHFLGSANMMTASVAAFDHNLVAPLRISSPMLKDSNMDLPKQAKLKRKMNPTLKEQLKQERWELESKVSKLSVRLNKESHKSYKQSISKTNGLNQQLAAPPSS